MYVTKARENALVYICNLITFSVFINFFPNFKKILCCFFSITYQSIICTKIKSWPMIHNSAIDKEYNHIQQVLKINIQIKK